MLHNSYKKIRVARKKPDLQDVNSHLWEKHVRIVSFYLTILSLSHNSGKKRRQICEFVLRSSEKNLNCEIETLNYIYLFFYSVAESGIYTLVASKSHIFS